MKSRTNRALPFLVCLALLLLTAGFTLSNEPPQQKKQPSLQETLQWLKETFESHGTYKWEGHDGSSVSLEKKAASFEGCTISWLDKKTMITAGGSSINFLYQDTVPLGELDATSIKAQHSPYSKLGDPGWIVGFTIVGKKESIKSKDLSDGEVNSFPGTMIWFDNQDVATRVAKAITHSSNLCRRNQPF